MNKNTALQGSFWSAIEIGSRQVVQFAISIALARLLTPSEFGTYAVIAFFSALAAGVLQSTFATALIRKKTLTAGDEDTVFWFSLSVSVVAGVVLGLSGRWIALFYQLPELAMLAWGVAGLILLNTLAIVPTALLIRRMQFKRIAIIGLASSLISGVVGVVMGAGGYGAWALLGQQASAAGLTAVTAFMIARWVPGKEFSLARLRDALGFTSWLSLAALSDITFTYGLGPAVGKMVGVAPMAQLFRAQSIQALPGNVLGLVFSRVMLPLMSQQQDDPAALRRYLIESNHMLMFFNIPAMIGLAATADLITKVLFGPQWDESAPLLAVLAIGAVVYPMHLSNVQILLATGQSRQVLSWELAKKAAMASCLVAGWIWLDLFGIAVGLAAGSVIALALNAVPVRRTIGLGLGDQLQPLLPIFGAGLAMGLVLLGLRQFLNLDPLATLAIMIAAGAVSYAIACWVLNVHAARQMLLRLRLLRSPSATVVSDEDTLPPSVSPPM